jgi:hypothetical protein
MDVVCATTTVTELDRDSLGQYTDAEIRQVHYCKSYLKVKRVSDLCTADGVFTSPSILKGELSIRQCASKLEDIRQERPQDTNVDTQGYNNTIDKKTRQHEIGTEIKKYWNGIPYKGTVTNNNGKYYKIQYDDNDEEELNHGEVRKYSDKNRGEGRTTREIRTRMRLRKPLGELRILANESEQLWPFYYSHNTDTLYRSYREEWHRFSK